MNFYSFLVFLDYFIAEKMVFIRTDFFDSFFMYITRLGGWPFIVALFLFFSIILFFYGNKKLIIPFFFSLAGTGITTLLLKIFIGRDRPNPDWALYTEKLSSFPSAHASLILSCFGFLLLCIYFSSIYQTYQKAFLFILGFLLIVLVGFSRLYLGVHFLTDIVAGYLIGLLWLFIALYFIVTKTLFRR